MPSFIPKFRNVKLSGFFSVRARLALLAVILVLPFMADRVRVLESSRASQAKTIAAQLLTEARHSATAQREMMSSIEALLRTAAFSYAVADSAAHGCRVLRTGLNVELPWITSLSIAGADGKILCSTLPNYEGLNLGDRDYFQSALQDRRFVLSNYRVSRVTGRPALLAAYAPPVAAGNVDIVVVAGVNLQWMTQLMNGLRERPGVVASVIDADGVVLATQIDDPDLIGRRLRDPDLLRMVTSQEQGSTTIRTPEGARRALSFTRIPDTGVRLMMSVDETAMLRAIDRDIRKAYLQLGIVTILVLFGAWLIGERLIIRPIRELTTMTTRIGEGDLSARSVRRGLPPEFAQLASALNVMADQLGTRERELRASNSRLAVLASQDSVSELANRRGFDNRLAFEWARAEQDGRSLALMMIDIDHFKSFNDTYGHLQGDACLRSVSKALQGIATEIGGFAARYGGEEFCLMVPGAELARAHAVAELLRTAIEQLGIPHAGAPLGCVTVSVGISVLEPSATAEPKSLVEAADAGLYAAKRRGRNVVVEHSAIMVVSDDLSAVG